MTKEELLEHTKPVDRNKLILQVEAKETLIPGNEGVFLNEGYSYELDGSIPQIADSIAKLAIQLDLDTTLGDNAGQMFINLIEQYYIKTTQEAKES